MVTFEVSYDDRSGHVYRKSYGVEAYTWEIIEGVVLVSKTDLDRNILAVPVARLISIREDGR